MFKVRSVVGKAFHFLKICNNFNHVIDYFGFIKKSLLKKGKKMTPHSFPQKYSIECLLQACEKYLEKCFSPMIILSRKKPFTFHRNFAPKNSLIQIFFLID